VSKQWALHAVVVGLETAMRESDKFVRKRWVLCTRKVVEKTRKEYEKRWEQTCSKGMMMMMFMEGGGFHAVAAWRKAGRLWEGPQFRNLPIASDVSPPSSLW
jgi:hypothetical protein